MQKFPHFYKVRATGQPTGAIATESAGLPVLKIAAPKQFDGPGDQWSPEDLLMAAIADCLILTFRSIATASKFEWLELNCDVKGTLERIENKTQFTEIFQVATLKVNSDINEDKAKQLLEKAEKNCLITNSLTANVHLETNILKD
jgi:peroxiredoxin-like protein